MELQNLFYLYTYIIRIHGPVIGNKPHLNRNHPEPQSDIFLPYQYLSISEDFIKFSITECKSFAYYDNIWTILEDFRNFPKIISEFFENRKKLFKTLVY